MFPTSHSFDSLQQALYRDLGWLLPELLLCLAMVLMLFLRLFDVFRRRHMGTVAVCAAGVSFATATRFWFETPANSPVEPLFSGLLISDSLSLYGRMVLTAGLLLFTVLTLLTNVPDVEDSPDFYVLLFGSTLGMMLMTSANHLLMVFIAVEMASVPSYVLSGFFKGNRRASEAALKYVVYGAAASGTMLYGMSLLTSVYGSGSLDAIANGWFRQVAQSELDPIALGGVGLIFVGLAFKLALVPFHVWCPDVFEGASAEIAAYLSVASKAAAFILTARFLLTLTGPILSSNEFWMVGRFGLLLAFAAAITCTLGNLAALGQTNIKRLLAYSTIAHAGYMFMGLAFLTGTGAEAMLFYLPVYLFMNLAAFATVCFLRNATGSENIADYAGLVKREPLLVTGFAIAVMGLLGLPPLAGFAAKFQIFASLVETGRAFQSHYPTMSYACYGLLAIAAINTVISAVYYLRILRVMVLDEPAPNQIARPVSSLQTGYVAVLAAAIFALGILWNPLEKASRQAADSVIEAQKQREKNGSKS